MGSSLCKTARSKQTIPVFVKVLNEYPFCGTINIKIKKQDPNNLIEINYNLHDLINDVQHYLQTYHRNTEYFLHKIIYNGHLYSWNDNELNLILNKSIMDNTDLNINENMFKLYFICEQEMEIAVNATYIDRENANLYYDNFKISIAYSNNYTTNDLLYDITEQINKRRISSNYESKDVLIRMNTNINITNDISKINEPISIKNITYISNNGISVQCAKNINSNLNS